MTSAGWSALSTVVVAAVLTPAMAQTGATPAPTAASVPPAAAKAGPRRPTPTELRDSATIKGDLRPDDRVIPQIVIPLRKGAAPTKTPSGAARRAAPAASGGIDDAAARCEAASTPQAREQCREARGGPARQR
jgi:hypothetical protein